MLKNIAAALVVLIGLVGLVACGGGGSKIPTGPTQPTAFRVVVDSRTLLVTFMGDTMGAWDFGDGMVGEGVTVTHTYERGGTYPVTYTKRSGSSATESVVVTPARVDLLSGTSVVVEAGSGGSTGLVTFNPAAPASGVIKVRTTLPAGGAQIEFWVFATELDFVRCRNNGNCNGLLGPVMAVSGQDVVLGYLEAPINYRFAYFNRGSEAVVVPMISASITAGKP